MHSRILFFSPWESLFLIQELKGYVLRYCDSHVSTRF